MHREELTATCPRQTQGEWCDRNDFFADRFDAGEVRLDERSNARTMGEASEVARGGGCFQTGKKGSLGVLGSSVISWSRSSRTSKGTSKWKDVTW